MKPKSKYLLTPIRTTSRLAALAAAVIVAAVTMAVLANLAERSAHALPTNCSACARSFFGMVGIVPGQTARLNVFTQAASDMPVASPTMITLSFIQSNGNQLVDPVSGQPAQTSLMLPAGEAASLDLGYPVGLPSSGPFAAGGRVEIRALVQFSSVDGGPATSDVVASLELFDTATGKTSVVLVLGSATSGAGAGK